MKQTNQWGLFALVLGFGLGVLSGTLWPPKQAKADDSSNSSQAFERMIAHQKSMADSQERMARALEKSAEKCK